MQPHMRLRAEMRVDRRTTEASAVTSPIEIDRLKNRQERHEAKKIDRGQLSINRRFLSHIDAGRVAFPAAIARLAWRLMLILRRMFVMAASVGSDVMRRLNIDRRARVQPAASKHSMDEQHRSDEWRKDCLHDVKTCLDLPVL